MGCDRTWDLSGANVPSLLQQVQPASNWRFLGNAEQNGRDRGTIFSARTDWTTGGLGTSLGQMRRRDFSRYNRQAIGDSSAMLNKMAGTVGPSCWEGLDNERSWLFPRVNAPSLPPRIHPASYWRYLCNAKIKRPGIMVAPSGVQLGLDNVRSWLLPRVNAPSLQTWTRPAGFWGHLCEAR
jgi:hypothetical protein